MCPHAHAHARAMGSIKHRSHLNGLSDTPGQRLRVSDVMMGDQYGGRREVLSHHVVEVRTGELLARGATACLIDGPI